MEQSSYEMTEEQKQAIEAMSPEEQQECRNCWQLGANTPGVGEANRAYALAIVAYIDSLQPAN